MKRAKAPLLGVILKGFPRISETFISNEILLLEKQGLRLHLFSMRQPRESFSHESVKQIRAAVDYLPETLLRPLPKFLYHNLQLAAKQPKTYALALKTAYQRFLRTRKSATIKHLFQAGYLVHHLLPRRPVTHLHAHFAHSPASVALFTSRLSGLPFSFTAHAKDIYTSHPEQLREKIQLARFVVTCTENNRVYLNQIADGAGTAIYRVYHGIDTELFSTTEQVGLQPSAPYRILTVARLTAKKGLPTVYRALKMLQDQGMPFRHTLIGDGEDREKISALIGDLGLSAVCRCLGTQPHEVVLDQYRQADVFVLGCEVAASGDRDGIPNVCLESMAMGVPVAATSISAIPELVESEISGLLVAPGRPDQLANAMLRLLTDSDLRARLIPAARQRVRQFFDCRKLSTELAEIYRRQGLEPDSQDARSCQRGFVVR